MAHSKRSNDSPDEKGRGGENGRPRRHRNGRDREVIEQINDRRFQGSAPITAAAYSHALEQWHKLQGAIVSPPTDIGRIKPTPLSGDSTAAQ